MIAAQLVLMVRLGSLSWACTRRR